MFGHRLLLLIAVLATLVVLGCWDNRREMERVLEQGYPATAQITGAQYQRTLPLAVDGWRPRLVEQEISVDLKWQGKDGKEHAHAKVPVTERFARTVVSGDQVRLMPVGIKALDDEQSVPVIVLDASPRLASLADWTTTTGYMALAAWAAFAGLTVWRRRLAQARRPAAPARDSARDWPPKRTAAGLVLLCLGGFLAFQAWSGQQARESAATGGVEVSAEILSVTTLPAQGGGEPGYGVQLAWKDALGAVRHFGPVPISKTYWQQITTNGELSVRRAAVRVRDDDPKARPVIVGDLPEAGWQERGGLIAGLLLILLGVGSLASAWRHATRSR